MWHTPVRIMCSSKSTARLGVVWRSGLADGVFGGSTGFHGRGPLSASTVAGVAEWIDFAPLAHAERDDTAIRYDLGSVGHGDLQRTVHKHGPALHHANTCT